MAWYFITKILICALYRIIPERSQWLECLGIEKENYKYNKEDSICSRHFMPNQMTVCNGRRTVNLDALPLKIQVITSVSYQTVLFGDYQ